MSRILVVDDKEMMRDSVGTTLARKGHTIVVAPSAKAALEKIAEKPCDAVITDLQMPEMDGVGLLAEIRRFDEQLPVLLMTAYGTVESAVEAMKSGAYDYITKPFTGDALIIAVERALERARLVKENSILQAERSAAGLICRDAGGGGSAGPRAHELIGDSRCMAQLRERLGRIADSHGTVLISGESGAGKEVAARWIHEHSPRAAQPFLALNCVALSTNLLESELFGHEKGAFTGADKLRKGRFELVDGGTLLLDEISEVAPEIQAKLLRVLQERTFERVGSSTGRAVDVRVIATTNRDLPAEVEKGTFRQDLYFRLNVLPLRMPALREHPEDIAPLALHFLGETAAREGRAAQTLEPEAIELLNRYPWPGNVRELQNICERAAVLAGDETIRASLIAPWLAPAPAGAVVLPSNPMPAFDGPAAPRTLPSSMIEVNGRSLPNGTSADLHAIVCDGTLTLDDVEREVIVATLQRNRGHRQRSAAALGIGVRTLGLKLKKWKEEKLVSETL